MKKAAYGLLGLIVVLVAVALIGPSVINWNGYKAEISAEVEKATGRTLDIAGDLEFAILPAPRLRISDARLSNAPGAVVPHMVALQELRVSVGLLALLQGDIEIGKIALIAPVIELEKLPNGQMNWLFAPESDGSAGSAAPAAGPRPSTVTSGAGQTKNASAFRLDALTIENGTIVYRDTASGTIERIRNLTADISAGSFTGPFAFKGGLTVRDTPLTVKADVRRFVEKGALPFHVTLGAPGSTAEINLSGTVTDVETKPSISAKLDGKGDNLAGLLASLTRSAPLAQLGQSFAVSATMAGSEKAVAVNDLVLQLGKSTATGNIRVALENGIRADVAVRMASLDADAFLAVSETSRSQPASPGSVAPSSESSEAGADNRVVPATPAPAFELPNDIEANIDLTIDEVVAMQDRIRAVRLAVSLKGGAITLNTLTARFPGATELSASGTLSAPKGALTYAGKAAVRSTNLRRLLAWSGVDVSTVPADRLRHFIVSTDVSGNSEQVQAAGIVAQLDASRMSGGVTVALRERAAFGASFSIDQINADAYIGKKVAAHASKPPSGDAGPKPDDKTTPGVVASGPLTVLNDFDANLTFRVGSLSYQRMAIQGVRLDGTLVNGVMTLRDASVRNLAGTSGQVKGALSGFDGIPTFKGTITAASDNLTGFFRIAGIDAPVDPRKLGKMRLTSRTDASENGLTIDAKLQLAEVTAKIVGKVSALSGPSASPALDISVDAQHPELARLANVFAAGKPGPAVGRVGLKLNLKGNGNNVTLDINGGVAGGAFRVGGTIGTPLGIPKYDITADMRHPNLVRFVRAFDPGFKPANPRLGGLSMAVKLSGSEDAMAITGLTGKIGPTSVSGEGSYRAAGADGARPDVKLSLVTSTIPLSDFLEAPPRGRRTQQGVGQPSGVSPARTGAGGASAGQRWSREQINTDALGVVDANIDLRAEAVLYKTFRVDQPKIVAVLKDKVLDVQRITGTMFDGGFEMRGKVDGRGVPVATTSLTVTKANVGKALFQAAEFDIATGILSFGMDLSARGRSELDMIRALSGKGKIDVVDGVVKGFELKRVSENLKNINQLAGLLGALTSAMDGGETKFSSLKGTFDITKGVMITNDLQLVADAGAGNARGFVDLPRWNMEMNADFRLTDHADAPPFRVRAVGAPDNPRRLFDFQALQAWVLQRGIGGLIQNLVPGAKNSDGGLQLQQQQQPRPEDIIRGLLKGLGR